MRRIVVVGVGGIGGVLAARLARAGVDVLPVTGNAEISAAIAENGMRVVELDGSSWSVAPPRPARVALEPGDGPFDLCLLATKATTMEDALVKVVPHLAPGAAVVTLQNGLPEEIAARVVGVERVAGCVVGFGATMTAPGVYTRTSRGGLQLGKLDGGPSLEPIAELLGRIEETSVTAELAGVRWSKLAINCATSTLGAIGGLRLGPLLRRRFVRRLVLELWTEIAAVARASGVRLALVGGTLDVEKLALTDRERSAALGSPALTWKHTILVGVGVKYRRMRSSMLIAIERGRIPEIDFLNGEVVRRGAALGVATPVNARLCTAVAAIVAGRERPAIDHLRQVYDETVGAQTARDAA